MLTMRPQPSSSMSGTTAWQQLKVPVRLTARIRFQSSRLIFRNGSKPWSPALFTRMVGLLRRLRTSATPVSIWARSVTSTVRPIAVPPDAAILAAASSAELPSLSKTATAAPSAARRSLTASPMPEPPPVTIAVRPELIEPRGSGSDAVEQQVPQLLGRIGAARIVGGLADRGRERVEHDRLERHPGDALPVEAAAHRAGGDGLVEDLLEQRDERREGAGGLFRVRRHQLLGEVGEGEGRRPSPALLRRRTAQGVVLDDEAVEPLALILLALDAVAELVRRRPHGLLEQGEQQLLLPSEVLVEAPERLAGLLDHVLHREVLTRRAVAQQLEGGVDEALHPALGPHPRRIE